MEYGRSFGSNSKIQVSGALSWCHPLLMYVQGLGALDARLFLDEETCPFEDDAVWATPDLSVGLADRIVLSQLWVLGWYEVIRTTAQRAQRCQTLFGVELTKQIVQMKWKLARLRMPLAKLEASSRHPDDLPFPAPAFGKDVGIMWVLDKGVAVSRRELAEELLALLTKVSEYVVQSKTEHRTPVDDDSSIVRW